MTYSLVLHTREDYIQHLCERSFCCRLVDKVTAGKVNIVTRANGKQ